MKNKKSILVVDDYDNCRNLIIKALLPYNYEVNAVQDGEDALKCLVRGHYDLLITDVQMPGISGIKLIKKVWLIRPETKVIIVSGNIEMAGFLKSIVVHGVLEYLSKPLDLNELRNTVAKLFS